jgi:hypothetical protein
MTCIAGLVHNGRVYLGGDRAGVEDWNLTTVAAPKVFLLGPFVVGFTSSFRMGQLLRYAFTPPKLPPRALLYVDEREQLTRYMVVEFVDALRKLFSAAGFATKSNEQEAGGQFLVGVRGLLFKVESDYTVAEALCGYDAVGCGHAVAKGALYVGPERGPQERLLEALKAAEAWSAGVRAPFDVAVSEL